MYLTDNIKKGHLMEIFEQFGTIVDITMTPSKAVISFETKAIAKKATKIMNGGYRKLAENDLILSVSHFHF